MKTVLVADDDKVSQMYAEMIVRNIGAGIIKADNDLKAVEAVKAGFHIDLILMDIRMPVMNGYEATQIIKKINDEIQVIALTSFSQERQKKKMREAGCDKILTKPISAEILRNTIKEIIEAGNDN